MKSKISLKWPLLFISIAGIVFSSTMILWLTFNQLVEGSYAKSAAPASSQASQNIIPIQNTVSLEQNISGLPVRLKIPKINVDSAIEHLGLTPDGAVGVPNGPVNTAWYDLGPRPGDNGSAVISGHFGYWENGSQGVFNDLYKLSEGDKLYIEDDKGKIVSFVVRESRSYDPKANALDVFNSSDGKPHLNLITCEGVWDKVSRSYSKRLVIFTDKE